MVIPSQLTAFQRKQEEFKIPDLKVCEGDREDRKGPCKLWLLIPRHCPRALDSRKHLIFLKRKDSILLLGSSHEQHGGGCTGRFQDGTDWVLSLEPHHRGCPQSHPWLLSPHSLWSPKTSPSCLLLVLIEN